MKRLATFFLVSLVLFSFWILLQIPSEKTIKGCLVTKMYAVSVCPGSNTYVPLKNISPYLQYAVVASEDALFWQHNGFDFSEISESAQKNFSRGKFLRGGSTISQQLAKNLFLTFEKSLIRKFVEALITFQIEKTLSKKEILERYLNVVEFGDNIYGVKAAASSYFKKSPAQLTVTEAAFLAMLLPNPKKYSQSYRRQVLSPFAKKRIKKIVSDMSRSGRISPVLATSELQRIDQFFRTDNALTDSEEAEEGQFLMDSGDSLSEPQPSPTGDTTPDDTTTKTELLENSADRTTPDTTVSPISE